MSDANATSTSKRFCFKKLCPGRIQFGEPLPGSIYSENGRVLIRKGRRLKPEDLELIQDKIDAGIYGGSVWPEHCFEDSTDAQASAEPDKLSDGEVADDDTGVHTEPCDTRTLAPISVEQLQVGQRFEFPIYDIDGVLLVADGMPITHRFLSHLRQRDVWEVHIPKSVVDRACKTKRSAERSRIAGELDQLVEYMIRTDLHLSRRDFKPPHLELEQLNAETDRGLELHRRAVDRVADISKDILRGRCSSVAAATEVIREFIEFIQLDSGLLPAIVRLKDAPGEYLFDHGLNVALLSMAVASQLSIRREDVLQIGVGALLQDVGMMEVDQQIRLAPRRLTPEEQEEIARHPLYSLESLQHIDGIGRLSLLICYQSHERVNGTGYPRQRLRERIHPYARMVAAADMYAALASNRPYRPAHSPYKAMEILLRSANRNLHDREAIRRVLDCVSLFPIGSYVKLSNGTVAKVIRAVPGLHTKPDVVLMGDDGAQQDCEVHLCNMPDLQVVKALTGLSPAA